MAYAIMRCEKIKNMGRLGGSFLHAFRERETLNADSTRTADNVDYFARNAEEAMTRAKLTLPEKIRKNGVIAVEYLFTASPEWFKTATSAQKKEFFDRSVDWLAEKYGRAHIITATVHNDETTPHLTAVVIPIDSRGKLNARGFIGGAEKLRKDQDTYAKAVSSLGLVRGIRGSKAKHQEISQWYGELHETDKIKLNHRPPSVYFYAEDVVPKKTGFLEREPANAVATRINERIKRSFDDYSIQYGKLLYSCESRQRIINQQQQNLDRQSEQLAEQAKEISSLKEVMAAFRHVLGLDMMNQIWQEYQRRQRQQEQYQPSQEQERGRNGGMYR